MIELAVDDDSALITIVASARLHRTDYARLVPEFEAFAARHDRVSILFIMRDFHGWDIGASWEDLKLWSHHFGDFRRLAFVGEHGWQRAMCSFCHVITTAPLKYFDMDDLDSAREWVQRPAPGTVHLDLNDDERIACVRLEGALTPEDFESVTPRIDQFIERYSRIRILLDLRQFEGWDSIEALADHFSFVKKHYRFAGRLAIIGNRTWQRLAATIIGAAVHPEVRFFSSAHETDARTWLRSD